LLSSLVKRKENKLRTANQLKELAMVIIKERNEDRDLKDD
jgi:hypothetical protein